jgi:hypothetical protein
LFSAASTVIVGAAAVRFIETALHFFIHPF